MARILVADDHDAADGIEAVTLFEGLSKPIDHRVLASEVDRLLRERPRG